MSSWKKYYALEVSGTLAAEYIIVKVDLETKEVKHFNSSYESMYATTGLDERFNIHLRESIVHRMEEFEEKDSRWRLHTIIHLAVHINKLNPLRRGCDIALTQDIQKKHHQKNRGEQAEGYWFFILFSFHTLLLIHRNGFFYLFL